MTTEKERSQIYYKNGARGIYDYLKVRIGGDTPAYLRRLGIYTENPYTVYVRKNVSTDVYIRHIIYTQNYSIWSSSNLQLAKATAVPAPTYADVLPNLAQNWRNANFNAGVFIGEGRESLQLIAQNLRRIADAAYYLRRGEFRPLFDSMGRPRAGRKKRIYSAFSAGNLANAWLELRYGWRPLINDIYNLTEDIKLQGKDNVINASAKHERLSYYYTSPRFSAVTDRLTKNERRLHIRVNVRHAPQFHQRWGLNDPTTIAWELVPLSFVIDWFLPIGRYLQSLHAIRTLPVQRSTVTTVYDFKREGTTDPLKVAYQYKPTTAAPYSQESFVMARSVSYNLPSQLDIIRQIPQQVRPVWDPSVARTLDASALLISRLGALYRR